MSSDGSTTGISRPRRLAHANLFASDLDRSERFYVDVVGLRKVFDERGIGAVFLSNGATHHDVALMQASDTERIGIGVSRWTRRPIWSTRIGGPARPA